MSLGKDSIQKRVAKPAEAAAPAAPKTTKAPAKKTTSTATRKAPVKTAVVSKVAPEVVEKVIGHEEGGKVEMVGLGTELPYYLL